MKRDPKKAAAIIAKRKAINDRNKGASTAPVVMAKKGKKSAPEGKPIFYAVTLFVHRQQGEKEDIRKHYESNRDPIIFFDTQEEMRAAQKKAMKAAFGHE